MTHKELTAEEAMKLITSSHVRTLETRSWPNIKDILLLAEAVEQKKPSVVFEGQRFNIRYTKHFGGAVFVSPDSTSFFPCGYFEIKKLMSQLKMHRSGIKDENL